MSAEDELLIAFELHSVKQLRSLLKGGFDARREGHEAEARRDPLPLVDRLPVEAASRQCERQGPRRSADRENDGEGAESVRRLVARQRPVGPPYSLVREFRDLFERADMLPGGYDFIHLVFWGVVSMVIVGTNLLPIALSMGIGILLFETLFRKG